jgi:hypothetical protein
LEGRWERAAPYTSPRLNVLVKLGR